MLSFECWGTFHECRHTIDHKMVAKLWNSQSQPVIYSFWRAARYGVWYVPSNGRFICLNVLGSKNAFMGGSQKSHVPNSKKIKEQSRAAKQRYNSTIAEKRREMSPIDWNFPAFIFMPKCFLPFCMLLCVVFYDMSIIEFSLHMHE